MRAFLGVLALVFSVTAYSQTLPSVLPDSWLLADQGPSWWYKVKPVENPTPLTFIDIPEANPLFSRAHAFTINHTAKVVALADGPNVVFTDFVPPAQRKSLLFSFSMGKTVTAMAVGQAICADKLTLNTKAKNVILQLAGTALGEATVRDLLMMASGAAEPNADSTIMNAEDLKSWQIGKLDLLDLVTRERVTKAQRGIFSAYKPGEHFEYKSTDPDVLGIMLNNTTGMTYAEWVQQNVFDKMGIANVGLIVQDPAGHGLAGGGIRLRLDDWVRFAWWVKQASHEQSCFGDFVRAAIATQIKNVGTPKTRKQGRLFSGYGYLTWTENDLAPNTFWAIGWGGQRIGWSRTNNHMIIVFSNTEEWMTEVYELAQSWLN